MPKLKLTDAAVLRIKLPPPPTQVDIWDETFPGFGLRVSHLGNKTWLLMVRILRNGEWKQTRFKIGRYPTVSLADARRSARDIQVQAQRGEDPRRVAAQKVIERANESKKTFAYVREDFLKRYKGKKGRLRAKTASEYRRVLTKDFESWDLYPIASITRNDVRQLLTSVADEGTPIKANRMQAYLTIMMNWSVGQDIIESAPTFQVSKPAAEVSRDRVLSDDEIRILWKALGNETTFGPLVKLLLLTGQRREEVAQMSWSELRLQNSEPVLEIPRERVKMDRHHVVPLSDLAVRTINSIPRLGDSFVFTTTGSTAVSGISRFKERLDRTIQSIKSEANMTGVFDQGWVIHDLRRTCATHLGELGVSDVVIELILNHRSGKRSGVAGTYNRSELIAERRRALDLWANHISSLVDIQPKRMVTRARPTSKISASVHVDRV